MEPEISSLAALIGEPARGRILFALLDGRSLPATELAQRSGITCQTASSQSFERGWIERVRENRAVRITELGHRELKRLLGVACDS